ncbi:MAG: hypothetical protein LH606_08200 [Cytophagaceae bacterium]|nr:hypothetical protein [Cytophagaceae bacterium]
MWADEPDGPEEVSGTAMVLGSVIEAVRRGWLPDSYRSFTDKAWAFVQICVDEQGKVHNAYTAWAVPAEAHKLIMDHKDRPFVNGMVLSAVAELYA